MVPPIVCEVKDGNYDTGWVPPGKYIVTIEGEGIPKSYNNPKTTLENIWLQPGLQSLHFGFEVASP